MLYRCNNDVWKIVKQNVMLYMSRWLGSILIIRYHVQHSSYQGYVSSPQNILQVSPELLCHPYSTMWNQFRLRLNHFPWFLQFHARKRFWSVLTTEQQKPISDMAWTSQNWFLCGPGGTNKLSGQFREIVTCSAIPMDAFMWKLFYRFRIAWGICWALCHRFVEQKANKNTRHPINCCAWTVSLVLQVQVILCQAHSSRVLAKRLGCRIGCRQRCKPIAL